LENFILVNNVATFEELYDGREGTERLWENQ